MNSVGAMTLMKCIAQTTGAPRAAGSLTGTLAGVERWDMR